MQVFFNPCPKWEQPEQHFVTVTHMTIITVPTNTLIPMGIISVNKDFGPNIRGNWENAEPGTERQIKFM